MTQEGMLDFGESHAIITSFTNDKFGNIRVCGADTANHCSVQWTCAMLSATRTDVMLLQNTSIQRMSQNATPLLKVVLSNLH